MSATRTPREGRVPIGGVILLFLGIVFLLQTLGILPWGVWGVLWRFWPVVLIIVGLGILLRHYNHRLVSLLLLALLFACLGIAVWQYHAHAPATASSYTQPSSGLESAQIKINFAAGRLTVASLAAASPDLVEVKSDQPDLSTDFQKQNGAAQLHLSIERGKGNVGGDTRWDVALTRTMPLVLDVEAAASDARLDFGELKVTTLGLNLDAGNFVVRMPSAGVVTGDVQADLSNLELTVPDGVAARLKVTGDLSSIEVDQGRFPKNGDYYLSPGFETAKNRVDMTIECHLGRLQVK